MTIPISVQLYTLREYTEKDLIGTLEKVAELGYKGVEFAGFFNYPAAEVKAALDRLGLKATGSHTGLDLLKNNLEEVIEYNLTIGNKYVSCPWETFASKEDYVAKAKFFNEVGQKLKERGITFCYHNHAHEFESFDGEYGLDILYKETSPENLKAEMDTYWVTRAGLNAPDYVRKYTGRCPLVHLKDMEPGEDKHFAEVGEGIIDIKAIVEAGVEGGAEWFIVEQDVCKRPALESIKISINNLRKMGLV